MAASLARGKDGRKPPRPDSVRTEKTNTPPVLKNKPSRFSFKCCAAYISRKCSLQYAEDKPRCIGWVKCSGWAWRMRSGLGLSPSFVRLIVEGIGFMCGIRKDIVFFKCKSNGIQFFRYGWILKKKRKMRL